MTAMTGCAGWRMSLGPAAVQIATPLALADADHGLRARGEPPMWDLTPAPLPSQSGPAVFHRPGRAAVTWDAGRSALTVTAPDNGGSIGERLLYLAQLVLEHALQGRGYVTLHAAAAAIGGRAVLLLGPTGAGKTMTLLRLCRDHGATLIGNDLVVVGGPGMDALAGTRHVRLRHTSVARVMPELLGLFPGDVRDSWRAKRNLDPQRLGIRPAATPVSLALTVFVHVDPAYLELVDQPGDGLIHRLNLHENALRYIRGGSTPWLDPDGRYGPYIPPLDDGEAHAARTATLERLLACSRYVAGPAADVAEHVASLTRSRPGGCQ